MATEYKTAIYTKDQLENARTKGQLVGWAQGGASVAALLFLLKFLGWIPLLAITAILGFVGYKFVTRKKA